MNPISHELPQQPDVRSDRSPSADSLSRVAFSVVVPCYNETENIPQLKQQLRIFSERASAEFDLEFVMVDDGSDDNTWRDLQRNFSDEPMFKLVRHRANQGLTAAILTGIRDCSHEIVCSIDSDCTYDPSFLLDLVPYLVDDVAVVTASPYHPQGAFDNVPDWRIGLSKLASRIYRLFMHNKLTCYTSCFRVYRRAAIEPLAIKNSGFVGIVELLWRIDRQGMRMVERPARLHVRQYGQSKMRVVSVGLGHLKLMIVMAVAWILRRRT